MKGNVRIRLHGFDTAYGTRYGVELSAYDSSAGQWKLLLFKGGMDAEDAQPLLLGFANHIRGFDWQADAFLLQ